MRCRGWRKPCTAFFVFTHDCEKQEADIAKTKYAFRFNNNRLCSKNNGLCFYALQHTENQTLVYATPKSANGWESAIWQKRECSTVLTPAQNKKTGIAENKPGNCPKCNVKVVF